MRKTALFLKNYILKTISIFLLVSSGICVTHCDDVYFTLSVEGDLDHSGINWSTPEENYSYASGNVTIGELEPGVWKSVQRSNGDATLVENSMSGTISALHIGVYNINGGGFFRHMRYGVNNDTYNLNSGFLALLKKNHPNPEDIINLNSDGSWLLCLDDYSLDNLIGLHVDGLKVNNIVGLDTAVITLETSGGNLELTEGTATATFSQFSSNKGADMFRKMAGTSGVTYKAYAIKAPPEIAYPEEGMYLPDDWFMQQHGTVSVMPSAEVISGNIEIDAVGKGVTNSVPSYTELSKPVYDEFDLSANVSSGKNSGIFLKDGFAADGAGVYFWITNNSYKIFVKYQDGNSENFSWLKGKKTHLRLLRNGNKIFAYSSIDGLIWDEKYSFDIDISASNNSRAGVFAYSGKTSKLSSSGIESINFSQSLHSPLVNIEESLYQTGDHLELSNGGVPFAVTRYTLDGTEPNESSTEYTDPIELSGVVLVRAKTYKYGMVESTETIKLYHQGEYINGLMGSYYEMAGPDQTTLASDSKIGSKLLYDFNLANQFYNFYFNKERTNQIASIFESKILVPHTGDYTFYFTCNDIASLTIDGVKVSELTGAVDLSGQRVFNNTGFHGIPDYVGSSYNVDSQPIYERPSDEIVINLEGGLHDIEIEYYKSSEEAGLTLYWSHKEAGKTVFPFSNFLISDDDKDGLPDSWEIENYQSLASDGSDDLDGDSLSDFDEFQIYKSNPEDSTSQLLPAQNPIAILESGIIATYHDIHLTPDLNMGDVAHYAVDKIDTDINLTNVLGAGLTQNFATRILAYLNVPEDAAYTFYLNCDDYGKLFIDGTQYIHVPYRKGTITGKVTLPLKAGLHRLEIETYQLDAQRKLLLEWESDTIIRSPISSSYLKRSVEEVEALESAIDTDADGVSDQDEIAAGTNPLQIDSDNDGLSDFEELVTYGTDALLADSDGDGLTDYEEVKLSLSDALTANFSLSDIQDVYEIMGSTFGSNTGNWKTEETQAINHDRRGYIEYTINVPSKDVYRLKVTLRDDIQSDDQDYRIIWTLDGLELGRSFPKINKNSSEEVIMYTPMIAAGTYTLGLKFDHYYDFQRVIIEKVNVQSIAGSDADANGIKDWIDYRFDQSSFSNELVVNSAISPACVEGRVLYLPLLSITDENGDSIQAKAGKEGSYYANLNLHSTEATEFNITYQNAALQEDLIVNWVETDIWSQQNSVHVRINDSLLLSALKEGDTSAEIEVEGQVFQVTEALAYAFNNAGTFEVIARSGQDSHSFFVEVVSYEFGMSELPAWKNRTREIEISELPTSVVMDADERIVYFKQSAIQPDTGLRYDLTVDENENRQILARLGNHGPIIDSLQVNGFDVQTGTTTNLTLTEILGDGTKVIEMGTVMSSPQPGVVVKLNIFIGGVVFDDGSVIKTINQQDWNEIEELDVIFIKPSSVNTETCHQVKVYDNGKLIGIR